MEISALASMDGEIIVWAVSHSAASLSESESTNSSAFRSFIVSHKEKEKGLKMPHCLAAVTDCQAREQHKWEKTCRGGAVLPW